MALRHLFQAACARITGRGTGGQTDDRVQRAALLVAESLETRRLLSLSAAQTTYDWTHLNDQFRQYIAAYEYAYPAFAAKLNADLQARGLPLIQPQAGTLPGASTAAKAKNHHHPKPHPHIKRPRRHHNKDGQGPNVTDFNYYYDQALPNQIAFTFNENVSASNWSAAVTVIDLNSGQSIPVTGTYSSALNTVIYNLNNNSELANGNYTAILHGSQITDSNGLKMSGSDGVAGDDYTANFFFNAADFNHDGNVDFQDLTIVEQNLNESGRTFSQGDSNYDGQVNSADLQEVLFLYGQSTPQLQTPGTTTLASATASSIQITWPASSAPDVTGYDIYRDSTRIATDSPGTSYTDSTLSAGVNHTYFVVAIDASGDSSYPSGELVAGTAPTVTTPAFQSSTLPQQLTFTFSQAVSAANWTSAFTLLDLNTAASIVPSSAAYDPTSSTVTYTFSPTSPLPTGNYAAILHTSDITTTAGVALAGSDGIAGHDYVYSFQAANNTSLPLLGAPGNLTLIRVDGGSVQFSWTAPSDPNVTAYDVYRNDTRIATNQTQTSITDTGLSANTPYVYFVVGKDASGDTSYISPELLASTTNAIATAPTAPVVAQVTAGSVLLTWTDADPLAVSYNLFRDGTQIASNLSSTSYLDTTVTPNTDPSYSVQAINPNGVASAMNPATSVLIPDSSTLPAGYTTTTPIPPTGLSATPGNPTGHNADSSITLNWTPSSTPNVTYEIDRNGVNIGGTAATTFADTGLDSNTAYNYSVIAYDSSFTKSPAATTSGTTAPDQTSPSAPQNAVMTNRSSTSISLMWSAAADNVAVDHYNIYVNTGQGPTLVGSTPNTFFTDTAPPGNAVFYYVTAVDAQGNESPKSWISVIAPTPLVHDRAEFQYIPPEWQNYFYADLESALLQRLGGRETLPVAADSPPPQRFYTGQGQMWEFSNGHAFQPATVYDSHFTAYWDVNNNGVYDSGDFPIYQALSILGQSGLYFLNSSPAYGDWTGSEPVWFDPNGNNSFDPSKDTVIYDPANVLKAGDVGTGNQMEYFYANNNPNEMMFWSNGDILFNQAFAGLYYAIDTLASYFATTPGAVLSGAGLPVVGSGGTVTIDSDYNATISGVSFPFEVAAGDSFYIDGHWCEYAGDTTVLTNSASVFSAPAAVEGSFPLEIVNWTLVPAVAAQGSLPALSYVPGEPDGASAIFPQQFEELRKAIESLSTYISPPGTNTGQGGPYPAVNIPDIPQTPIPLTTLSDYLNQVPDTSLDGVVQVPANLDSFGNDSGSIQVQPGRDMPQVYLPIFTDNSKALPIHGYIVGGGFGSSASSVGGMGMDMPTINSLGIAFATDWGSVNENPGGEPFAYSLDTYLRNDITIDEGDNHVKRIEVIRPDGNSVVFDFPWESTTAQFSNIGTPIGVNSNQLYVLRAVGDIYNASTTVYALEFPSGVTQWFATLGYGYGWLSKITYNGLEYDFPNGQFNAWESPWFPNDLALGQTDNTVSQRYNITINWNGGLIDSIDYAAKDGSETTVTALTYDSNNDITVLSKTVDGIAANDLSYSVVSVLGGFGVVVGDVETDRTGSVVSGNVLIKTTLPADSAYAANSYVSTAYVLNSDNLVTSQTVTLSENGSNPTTATTTYAYQTGRGRYDNGAPQWGKLTQINYPDGSWETFAYDDGTNGTQNTGWLYQDTRPFQSGTAGSSGQNMTQYSYDTSLTEGLAADLTALVEQPREIQHIVNGTTISTVMNRYGIAYDASGNPQLGPNNYETRVASNPSSPVWATAGLWSQTQITGWASYTTIGPAGNLSSELTYNSQQKQYTQQVNGTWGGNTLSQSTTVLNAFLNPVSATNSTLGSTYQADTSQSQDGFGRSTQDSLTGGLNIGTTYQNTDTNNDWFGPSTVTEADGSTTKYTYTTLGQIARQTIDANTSNAVQTSYTYDAAGNTTMETTTGLNSAGNPTGPSITNTYGYDAMGRLRVEIDNYNPSESNDTSGIYNRETDYRYFGQNEYIFNAPATPNQSEEIIYRNLDGTIGSDSGNAVTPTTYIYGTVSTAGTDAQGNPDPNVTAGSTWTQVYADGNKQLTTTYTNSLGEQYLTQTSVAPAPGRSFLMTDAVTNFDANGRPISSQSFDGSTTYTIYDPLTGQIGAQYVDAAGSPNYDPTKDPKTVYHFVEQTGSNNALTTITSPLASSGVSTPTGVETDTLSPTGVQVQASLADNGGLGTVSVSADRTSAGTLEDRLATTSTDAPTGSAGGWTSTTLNPDGTQNLDTYTGGVLSDEKTLGVGGAVVSDQSVATDPLQRITGLTDSTGTTSSTLYNDGTLNTLTQPGHNQLTINSVNPTTNDPQQITRPDGGAVTTPETTQGMTQSQSGAGVIAANFGYDSSGTGNLNSLTTFTGTTTVNSDGTLSGTGAATTSWKWDQATGELSSVKFADGTMDTYSYNNKLQLVNIAEPGLTASPNFTYDAAGDLTSWSLNDMLTGVVSSTTNLDSLLRPQYVTDTDNGKTFTETSVYNAQGQLNKTMFGSAANATVQDDYYQTGDSTPNASPGSVKDVTVNNLPNGQASVATSFNYDPSSQRIQTISVNGTAIQYGFTPAGQVSSVTIGGSDGSGNLLGSGNVVINYTPDSTDGSRLSELKVVSNQSDQTLFDEAITGYYQTDQRQRETVTRVNVADGGTTSTENDAYTYNYDPNQADALTTVKDGNGNTLYSYSHDGAGDVTGTSLGTANNVYEYSNLRYNQRGDVIDDGTYAFGWDANDRLISITPHNTSQLQLKFGYDSQGRRIWKDVYAWNGASWVLSYSRHYLYDGSNLVAELDGSNNLLTGYSWGPNGLASVTDYTAAGGPKTYIPIADASSNIVMLVDASSGSVAASFHYDPYGDLISSSGPAKNIGGFRGGGWYDDPEAPGIQEAEFRAKEGPIWLSRDPSGLAGGINPCEVDNGDPIDNSDVSGLAAQPVPPSGVPQIVVYRYTEKEWAAHRVDINNLEPLQLGKYQYVAVGKDGDPESVGSAALTNMGHGLRDFTWGWMIRPFGVPFAGPYDRKDYVDVVYHLSAQHYGGLDPSMFGTQNSIWAQEYKNTRIQDLSNQLNQQLGAFELEQFGVPIVVDTVGGIAVLRNALGEWNGQAGGVGPATDGRLSRAAAGELPVGSVGPASSIDESFAANRSYELNPKHGLSPRMQGGQYIGKRPTNGQTALNFSVSVGPNTYRRLGVDPSTGEIVVFDRDRVWMGGDPSVWGGRRGGIYHGHVRPWNGTGALTSAQKQVLVDAGLVDRNGRIIVTVP